MTDSWAFSAEETEWSELPVLKEHSVFLGAQESSVARVQWERLCAVSWCWPRALTPDFV